MSKEVIVFCIDCDSINLEISEDEKYIVCNDCDKRIPIENWGIGLMECEELE